MRDLESDSIVRSLGASGAEPDKPALAGPSISADGCYVAFRSRANNLVQDVFVHDRSTGLTVRANVGPGGVQADGSSLGFPRLTADGRKVLFHSLATNLLAWS